MSPVVLQVLIGMYDLDLGSDIFQTLFSHMVHMLLNLICKIFDDFLADMIVRLVHLLNMYGTIPDLFT